MRKGLVYATLLSAMLVMGCKDGKMWWDDDDKDAKTEMSAKDECAMCPGVQTASDTGTCSKCGMKVKG